MERAGIANIAIWIPASLQVLQDNNQLEAQINTLMGRRATEVRNCAYHRRRWIR